MGLRNPKMSETNRLNRGGAISSKLYEKQKTKTLFDGTNLLSSFHYFNNLLNKWNDFSSKLDFPNASVKLRIH